MIEDGVQSLSDEKLRYSFGSRVLLVNEGRLCGQIAVGMVERDYLSLYTVYVDAQDRCSQRTPQSPRIREAVVFARVGQAVGDILLGASPKRDCNRMRD